MPLLTDGTVVIFDDWYSFRGNPNLGEQRACKESVASNPGCTLTVYQREGPGEIASSFISKSSSRKDIPFWHRKSASSFPVTTLLGISGRRLIASWIRPCRILRSSSLTMAQLTIAARLWHLLATEHVKYHYQSNHGLAASRNTGIALAAQNSSPFSMQTTYFYETN